MKKLKLSLSAIAFVMGITMAFAFSPANTKDEATGLWYVSATSDMVADVGAGEITGGLPDCEQSSPDICAREFNKDPNTGAPTTPTQQDTPFTGERVE